MHPMMALAATLCAWGAGQDKDAEEAFRKIQESIGKAKTVSVKFRFEMTASAEGTERKTTASGSLRLKEGNRLSLACEGFGLSSESKLVSNGSKLRISHSLGGETHERMVEAPADLNSNFGAALPRLGLALPLAMLLTPYGHGEMLLNKGIPDFGRMFEISDLKEGKGEGTERTLIYLLRDKSPGIPKDAPAMTCTVWYDSRTFRLLKRTLALKHGPAEAMMIETYGEFSLDGALPDAEFSLPEPKGGWPLRTLSGHTGGVKSVAFSPDGRTLASGSWDNTIRLWDAAGGKELRTLAGHGMYVHSVAFSPDGKTLASGSFDMTIRLWDVASGKELWALAGHKHQFQSVAFSPDGKTLASGSNEHAVRLWDAATGKEAGTLPGLEESVRSVAFSPDGKVLASGVNNGRIKLWDVAGRKPLRTLPGHPAWISSVAFSPDGSLLASVSGGTKTVKLWDVAGGKEARTLWGHEEGVACVAFSPDGKTLASASGKTVKLWDVAGGKELRSFDGHDESVDSIAFSPDGKTLASSSGGKILLWRVKE